MKRLSQFAGQWIIVAMFAAGLVQLSLTPLGLAQESHVSREDGGWGQQISGSLAAVKNLRVKVDAGAVTVHGGGQSGINYMIHTRSYSSSEQDARRQFEAYKITAYVRGDTAWIVADWQGGRPKHFSGEFAINVPRDMSLVKIETAGGNVDASSVSGRVEAQSGGGNMHLDDIGGGAYAETGGGTIDVGKMSGDIGLHTGGGAITVHQSAGKIVAETGGGPIEIISGGQDASIETGGGSVKVNQCSGKVKVATGGGGVDLGDIGGAVSIETGGGNIHLASAKGYVHAETGGGGIELYGVPSAHAETGAGGIAVKLVNTGSERHDSVLETSAGDITVYIAADVALTVRANVDLGNGHHINSEFPDIHTTSEGEWGSKTLTAEGKLNGGGPVLKVHTTTGDIFFKHASH